MMRDLKDPIEDFLVTHQESLRELALCLAIPATAVLAAASFLPEPEPKPLPAAPVVEFVDERPISAAEPTHSWVWPLPEDEAPAIEKTSNDESTPRRYRRHRRHG